MALIKCEECGKEISDKAVSCPNCGCPISGKVNNNNNNLYTYCGVQYDISSVLYQISLGNKVNAIKQFRLITNADLKESKDVIDNDLSSYPKLLRYEMRCPKCGSTDFEMIRRNWSLFVGFMTNKVDRVCRSCKCKF